MTRRILVGFLGVLLAVIAAVVVPLGVIVTARQADDFRSATRTAAAAISAIAEEHLDDHTPITALTKAVAPFAPDKDGVAVLDAAGNLVARTGRPLRPAVLSAARDRNPLPSTKDTVVAKAMISDGNRSLGTVVLQRDTEPLDHRRDLLWLTLLSAAMAALAVGAAVALSLSRWIARPMTALAGVAHRVGAGEVTARADEHTGPQQVREVAGAFNDMTRRVEALIDTQRAMTADVSHQLRTPLASLRLRLELLAGDSDPARVEDVAAIIEETNRLARLVDGLLAVARAEHTPSDPTPTDLLEIARARVEAWQPVASERDIDLCVDGERAVVNVTAGNVEQVLDNLLDNAIEAVPGGGTIRVLVQPGDHTGRISVSDDGPGMSPERRAHALDRFVTDRAQSGGSGLGLTIVRRLVEADNGRLELGETPGGGLTLTITLDTTPRRGSANRPPAPSTR